MHLGDAVTAGAQQQRAAGLKPDGPLPEGPCSVPATFSLDTATHGSTKLTALYIDAGQLAVHLWVDGSQAELI